MREFTALKTLRMNWDYQLFGKSSRKPRMHSVGLPPELETLEFFHELGTDEEVLDLLVYLIQTKNIGNRPWKTMIAVESDAKALREVKEACKEQELQLDVIGAFDEEDTEEDGDADTEMDTDADTEDE